MVEKENEALRLVMSLFTHSALSLERNWILVWAKAVMPMSRAKLKNNTFFID
jgi:hypothetical protein